MNGSSLYRTCSYGRQILPQVLTLGRPSEEASPALVGVQVPGAALALPELIDQAGQDAATERWSSSPPAYRTPIPPATFGFTVLHLREIVSFTVPDNSRSRRVMEKISMTHSDSDDFDHPAFPEGHRLRRHVLYRLSR